MENLFLTIAIGFIGGFTAMRLKMPAGMMVGSLMAIAFFNVVTSKAFMPQDVRIITQIAAGAFIGSGINRKDFLDMRFIIKPALLMVIVMIVLNIAMGYLMSVTTGMDLITCLFASAPGGIVDMSLISGDMGADPSKVAILQLVRLLIVFTILPVIMKYIHSKVYSKKVKGIALEEISVSVSSINSGNTKPSLNPSLNKEKTLNLALTLVVAMVFGLVGYWVGIPAGTMSFAMIAVGALNIFTGRGYMPLGLRRVTQVFAGILIGGRMTYSDVLALQSVFLPAIILLVGIIVVNLLIGYFISKASGIEIVTSLLASAPGGLSDMALIAKELGGDGPKVAIMQLARYISIVAFYPLVIKFLISLL